MRRILKHNYLLLLVFSALAGLTGAPLAHAISFGLRGSGGNSSGAAAVAAEQHLQNSTKGSCAKPVPVRAADPAGEDERAERGRREGGRATERQRDRQREKERERQLVILKESKARQITRDYMLTQCMQRVLSSTHISGPFQKRLCAP